MSHIEVSASRVKAAAWDARKRVAEGSFEARRLAGLIGMANHVLRFGLAEFGTVERIALSMDDFLLIEPELAQRSL